MELVIKLFSMAFKMQKIYKLNFVIMCISVMPIHLLQAAFSWIIATRFSGFARWSAYELIFLYGILLTSYSIAQVFFREFRSIDTLIIKGDLDYSFIRPQSILFSMVFSNIRLMEIVSQLLPSVILLLYSCVTVDIAWDGSRIIVLIGAIVGGSVIQGCIFILIGLISFWTIKSSEVGEVFYSLKEFMNYPIDVYGKEIVVFLTYVIPLAFINYYPACYILAKQDGFSLFSFLTLPVSCMVAVLTLFLWNIAIKNYSSVGS